MTSSKEHHSNGSINSDLCNSLPKHDNNNSASKKTLTSKTINSSTAEITSQSDASSCQTALSNGVTPLNSGNNASATPTPGKKKKRRRKKTNQVTGGTAVEVLCTSRSDSKQRQSQMTDFYPVRRSDRRTKSQKEQDEKKDIITKIKTGSSEGLEVQDIPEKGRGVIAMRSFKRGEFIVEYDGDLISIEKAKER
jgi:hypothetical protein